MRYDELRAKGLLDDATPSGKQVASLGRRAAKDLQTAKATLPVGTPLFVLESKANFVEVMLPGGERGWMLNTDLARDPEELTSGRS